ncbi:MAG: hypothetical protein AAGA20_17980, partial [Planctomycetota bacterium]
LIYGPGLMAHRVEAHDHPRERPGDAQQMRCVVHSECEARVVDASPAEGRATHFKVLAPDGTALQLTFAMDNGFSQSTGGRLDSGRSPTFKVSSEAATLELWRNGDRVESRPIRLDPGSLNELLRN